MAPVRLLRNRKPPSLPIGAADTSTRVKVMLLLTWLAVTATANAASAIKLRRSNDAQLTLREENQKKVWPTKPYKDDSIKPRRPQLCYANLHTWVTHGYTCRGPDSTGLTAEDAGCNIDAYPSKWPAVHWNLGGEPLYKLNPGYFNCPNDKGKLFPIPDYCSRAIVAELSQIYDGHYRVASTGSFWKHMFGDDGHSCPSSKTPLATIMNLSPKSEACWGFTAAYKQMYCSVYHRCRVRDDSDPNMHANLIECCKNQWITRVARYKKAGIYDGLKQARKRTFAREKGKKRSVESHTPSQGQTGPRAPGFVGRITGSSESSAESAKSSKSSSSSAVSSSLFG